ncbi:hypothetical protein CBR_g8615 [Chara braunii]|uniref:Transmembrane protein n=1 Tax=Chara braunii TaxID=69332 RepID=A0A388JS05_CHABU|nr:hypothetical protein CBR_g8615 [Chara braunii]|eukprot:GBG60594.1 hypothetical protein CBR_g8615 [Chara braunii]
MSLEARGGEAAVAGAGVGAGGGGGGGGRESALPCIAAIAGYSCEESRRRGGEELLSPARQNVDEIRPWEVGDSSTANSNDYWDPVRMNLDRLEEPQPSSNLLAEDAHDGADGFVFLDSQAHYRHSPNPNPNPDEYLFISEQWQSRPLMMEIDSSTWQSRPLIMEIDPSTWHSPVESRRLPLSAATSIIIPNHDDDHGDDDPPHGTTATPPWGHLSLPQKSSSHASASATEKRRRSHRVVCPPLATVCRANPNKHCPHPCRRKSGESAPHLLNAPTAIAAKYSSDASFLPLPPQCERCSPVTAAASTYSDPVNRGGCKTCGRLRAPGDLMANCQTPSLESSNDEISLSECWQLAALAGLSDTLVDVDRYFCYLVLIRLFGCDFHSDYGLLFICYTVTYVLWSPLAGLCSDRFQDRITELLAFSSALLFLSYLLLIFLARTAGVLPTPPMMTIAVTAAAGALDTTTTYDAEDEEEEEGETSLTSSTCLNLLRRTVIALYVVRSVAHLQLSSAAWKAIKLFLHHRLGDSGGGGGGGGDVSETEGSGSYRGNPPESMYCPEGVVSSECGPSNERQLGCETGAKNVSQGRGERGGREGEEAMSSVALLHERALNKLGTFGDLASEVFEVLLLLLAAAAARAWTDYALVAHTLDGGVFLISLAMLLLSLSLLTSSPSSSPSSSFLSPSSSLSSPSPSSSCSAGLCSCPPSPHICHVSSDQLQPCSGPASKSALGTPPQQYAQLPRSPSTSRSDDCSLPLSSSTNLRKPLLTKPSQPSSQARCHHHRHHHGESCAQEPVEPTFEVDMEQGNSSSALCAGMASVAWFLRVRLTYIFSSSGCLFHCTAMGMLSVCFTSMFDGPITLATATITQHPHGICDGAVDFILIQTLILQLTYFLGGAVYYMTIMKMHPATYYRKFYPFACVLFLLSTALQVFPMSDLARAVLLSVTTVVSYYSSVYNSYVLFGLCTAPYFGFVQSFYSVMVGLGGLVPSVLQFMNSTRYQLLTAACATASLGFLQSLNVGHRLKSFGSDSHTQRPKSSFPNDFSVSPDNEPPISSPAHACPAPVLPDQARSEKFSGLQSSSDHERDGSGG